jgi:hypothetical protein
MPSVSKKQHNLMAMVANDPAAAKRLGIKPSVGKEFIQADKGKKFGSGGMADGKDITDRIAREENAADLAAMDRYTVAPVKRGLGALKDAIMGTKEQNAMAAARMKARDEANPDSPLTKMNRTLGYKKGGKASCGMKKGGAVRGCGCAVKGKTKGRMV